MIIKSHRDFEKHYRRLPPKLQYKVKSIIRLFVQNRNDPRLDNHALHGALLGKRSISVTGNVRIIFEEFENCTLVVFLDIGTHSQVYQ